MSATRSVWNCPWPCLFLFNSPSCRRWSSWRRDPRGKRTLQSTALRFLPRWKRGPRCGAESAPRTPRWRLRQSSACPSRFPPAVWRGDCTFSTPDPPSSRWWRRGALECPARERNSKFKIQKKKSQKSTRNSKIKQWLTASLATNNEIKKI